MVQMTEALGASEAMYSGDRVTVCLEPEGLAKLVDAGCDFLIYPNGGNGGLVLLHRDDWVKLLRNKETSDAWMELLGYPGNPAALWN